MPRPPRPAPAPGALGRDLPPPPGVTLVEGGADVAVYAGHADGVYVCMFDAGDVDGTSERRVPLVERAHGWWFGFVPGMGPGQRYNVRVAGEWSPDTGQRHNAAKLLLDPYARALEGRVSWGPELYGHVVDDAWHGDGELRSDLDSRGSRAALRRRRRRVRLGGRPPAEPVAQRDRHLRGARAQPDRAAPRRARGAARHLRRAGAPRVGGPPHRARRHRRRAAAGARLHLRAAPGAARADQPLGLQHPRLLRTPPRLRRRHRPAGRASTRSRAWSSCCTARASR